MPAHPGPTSPLYLFDRIGTRATAGTEIHLRPGTNTIRVKLDDDNVVAESDERNNEFTATIYLNLADDKPGRALPRRGPAHWPMRTNRPRRVSAETCLSCGILLLAGYVLAAVPNEYRFEPQIAGTKPRELRNESCP